MNLEAINPGRRLDTTGLTCPMPLLKTKKILSEMTKGEIVEVISSDPGSNKDIPRFGNKKGNVYLGNLTGENGTLKYYIKKG